MKRGEIEGKEGEAEAGLVSGVPPTTIRKQIVETVTRWNGDGKEKKKNSLLNCN